VACSAGDRIGRHATAQLGEIPGVDVGGHFDHYASFFFDRIRIRGEVVSLGLGVPVMAEGAFDTEVALILVHEFNDIIAGDVFGESLDVGGIGTWSAGLAGSWRGLCRRWGCGSFLGPGILR
jgi:hypothetical protein